VFNGNPHGILNFTKAKYQWALKLWDLMEANTWFPKEVDTSSDVKDYSHSLTEAEKRMYDLVWSQLISMDSFQTNNLADNINPYITAPEINACLARQAYEEANHSRSYSVMVEAVSDNTDLIYEMEKHDDMLREKNAYISSVYEELAGEVTDEKLLLAMVANQILEGIYFYSGFMFFYNLARNGKMSGSAQEIRYINRDENTHLWLFRNIIHEMKKEEPEYFTPEKVKLYEEMMREIQAVKEAIRPSETLFVVDSMTGQDAVNTAKEFNDRLDFNGVVLTKLDGDTRGGAALSIRTVVDKPIKFVGMGEKMDALDVFHPERMADRILGMGDIVSLVERAQQLYDEREARRLEERIAKDQFDFNDFLTQIHQIKKMGNIKDLAAMIPGVGKALKDIDINDDAFKSIEAIIYSMTPEERAKPHILDGHRRKRIALGSGTTVQDVNKLLTQFTQTRKMMKTLQGFKGGKMPKMPSMPMGKPRF